MNHLDDGRLRAFMDRELGDAEVEAVERHLEDCDACRVRRVALEERAERVARALARLDAAAPTIEARDAMLERIESSTSGVQVAGAPHVASVEAAQASSRARSRRIPLARAAMVALLLGLGVVTALPASPLREWITGAWTRATGLLESSDSAETTSGSGGDRIPPSRPDGRDDRQSRIPAGVRLDATGQEVSIVIRGLGPAALIIVRIVPGGEAGAFADDPATFRTSERRIEVSGAAERVFVDLPLAAAAASIEVNGGIYLRKRGDGIDATGPVEARTAEQIRFRVP